MSFQKKLKKFLNLGNLGIECDTKETGKIDSNNMNNFQSSVSYSNL